MAIYHFSAQIISRSQGRSSVAAAAYRSAEKIKDEHTGITHDFIRKSDVINTDILLPEDAPKWMKDRSTLWNSVEQVEKRKDAQLAREINVALPRELTPEQNWNLVTAFVKKECVDRGMVADVAFHRGHKGGEEQPHAHVMLTLREITGAGFGQKVRSWNQKDLLNHWREQWELHCNLALVKAGHDLRIDHRTLEAQGINLEAQTKIGPKAAQQAMARLAEHQALAERNGERLLANPSIALTAMTQSQSTFTHQDLARFVDRHTVDASQFDAVYARISAHPELVLLGQDDRGRDRFTTREQLRLETRMIDQAMACVNSKTHPVSEVAVLHAMDNHSLSDDQKKAFDHLTQSQAVACVVGFAGTGKSYLLGAAREAWEAQGYRVQGMTLSGIAAENLTGESGIRARTVSSRLWHWSQGRECLNHKDVVVVDEAAMLGSAQMSQIMDQVHRAGAKVVLIGDPAQLQAIEAGAAYRAIAERVGFVQMRDIRRQQVDWQRDATRDFASERTAQGLLAYDVHDQVHTFDHQPEAITAMIEQWDEVRTQHPEQSQLMLAYTRDEVHALNTQARAMREAQGELGVDHLVETPRGQRLFAAGDRIYFLRNDNQLQVKNGTLGTIEAIRGDHVSVRVDGAQNQSRCVEFTLDRYNNIDHGYAATVYKAQGVTVDRAYILASKYFDRHSTYVAMSRHRHSAELYMSRDEFPNFGRLSKTLGRERTKDVTLDYGHQRGFEIAEHKRLQDRLPTPTRQAYSASLTDERFDRAMDRLEQRQHAKAMRMDIEALEKKTGLSYSTEVHSGDQGIYRGLVTIADEEYGVLEQKNGTAKLIEADLLRSRSEGKVMKVEMRTDWRGEEQLKAFQPGVREMSYGRGRSL